MSKNANSAAKSNVVLTRKPKKNTTPEAEAKLLMAAKVGAWVCRDRLVAAYGEHFTSVLGDRWSLEFGTGMKEPLYRITKKLPTLAKFRSMLDSFYTTVKELLVDASSEMDEAEQTGYIANIDLGELESSFPVDLLEMKVLYFPRNQWPLEALAEAVETYGEAQAMAWKNVAWGLMGEHEEVTGFEPEEDEGDDEDFAEAA